MDKQDSSKNVQMYMMRDNMMKRTGDKPWFPVVQQSVEQATRQEINRQEILQTKEQAYYDALSEVVLTVDNIAIKPIIQGMIFPLATYSQHWGGKVSMNSFTVCAPVMCGQPVFLVNISDTTSLLGARIHIIYNKHEIMVHSIKTQTLNYNATIGGAIISLTNESVFYVVVTCPLGEDVYMTISTSLVRPHQIAEIPPEKQPIIKLSSPITHKAQYHVSRRGPDHKPLWIITTMIAGESITFTNHVLKDAKKEMRDRIDAIFGVCEFEENYDYQAYLAKVHNKEQHTLNGNTSTARRAKHTMRKIHSLFTASDKPIDLLPTASFPIIIHTTPVIFDLYDHTVLSDVTFSVPEGTPVTVNVNIQMFTPGPVATGAASVAINGDEHDLGITHADDESESGVLGGVVTFITEAVNTIETIFHDATEAGSWITALFTHVPESAALPPELPPIPLDIYFMTIGKHLYSTVNPYQPVCYDNAKPYEAMDAMTKQLRIRPVYHRVNSYNLWLAKIHNQLMHALNGNTQPFNDEFEEGHPEEIQPIVSVVQLKKMITDPTLESRTISKQDKKEKIIATPTPGRMPPPRIAQRKNIRDRNKSTEQIEPPSEHIPPPIIKREVQLIVTKVLDKAVSSEVIEQLAGDDDMMEEVLAVLRYLKTTSDPTVLVCLHGAIAILEYYGHNIDIQVEEDLAQAVNKYRQVDLTIDPDEQYNLDLKKIAADSYDISKDLGVAKQKSQMSSRYDQMRERKKKELSDDDNRPIKKTNSKKTVEEARSNYEAALQRHIKLFTRDHAAFCRWLILANVSQKYKTILIDRIFGSDIEALLSTKPVKSEYIIAYMTLHKIDYWRVLPYLLSRYGDRKIGCSDEYVFWMTMTPGTKVSEYDEVLQKQHNALMHALTGNTTQEIIDKSQTYDSVESDALAMVPKPFCHFIGYEMAARLGSNPGSINRNISDMSVMDWYTSSTLSSGLARTKKVGIHIPLSFMLPREVRESFGTLVPSDTSLPVTSVTLATPPNYEMAFTKRGQTLFEYASKNNEMMGRADNVGWFGFNIIDIMPLIQTTPPMAFVPDAMVLKMILLHHCLLTNVSGKSLPAGTFTFYDNATHPVIPVSLGATAIGLSALEGEDLGGATTILPFQIGSTTSGIIAQHLSRQTVDEDIRSNALYLPVGLVNMGGVDAAINAVLFLVCFAPWPFGIFSTEAFTTDSAGANGGFQLYTNTASLAYVPGIEPLHIILPRRISSPDPAPGAGAQAQANGLAIFRLRAGPNASTNIPANTVFNVNVAGVALQTINMAEFFYTWFGPGEQKITQKHVLNFLGRLSHYCDISDTTRAMVDVMCFVTYHTGVMLLCPHGATSALNQFEPESGDMQFANLLDGREGNYVEADWPQVEPRDSCIWVCETHASAWNSVAMGLRYSPNPPKQGSRLYRWLADFKYYLDVLFNSFMISLPYQMYFSQSGISQYGWTVALQGLDNVPQSIRQYCLDFYTTTQPVDCMTTPMNAFGDFMWGMCATQFNCAPQVLVYCNNGVFVNLYSRIMADTSSIAWSTMFDKTNDEMERSYVPCWFADIWYEIMCLKLPKRFHAPPIQTSAHGWYGYSDGMIVIDTLDAFSGYIDPVRIKHFGATDSQLVRFSDESTWNDRMVYYDGQGAYTHNGTDPYDILQPGMYPTQRIEGMFWIQNVIPGISAPNESDYLHNTSALLTIDYYGAYLYYYYASNAAAREARKWAVRSDSLFVSQWSMNPAMLPGIIPSPGSGQITHPTQKLMRYPTGMANPMGDPPTDPKNYKAPPDALVEQVTNKIG